MLIYDMQIAFFILNYTIHALFWNTILVCAPPVPVHSIGAQHAPTLEAALGPSRHFQPETVSLE
jgi:hypothetical protein